jgi:protein subunit release factor A
VSESNPPGDEPRPDDAEALLAECRWEAFTGSGPGGQRRNRKATAIRLTHLPSGITVIAQDERSQARNRAVALERLRRRLELRSRVRTVRVPTKVPRSQKEQRLEQKKRRAEKLATRRPPDREE